MIASRNGGQIKHSLTIWRERAVKHRWGTAIGNARCHVTCAADVGAGPFKKILENFPKGPFPLGHQLSTDKSLRERMSLTKLRLAD